MNTKRLLTMAVTLCCMAATMPDLQAQNGEMKWFKQYCGRDGKAISSNKIIDAKMDNNGNTYVFGMMGHGARIDGQYICPADSSRHSIDPGYFLAKVDTAGNVPWIRATRIGGSGFSQNAFLGMTVKNGLIYIGQNETMYSNGNYVWYWFIDTVYWRTIPDFPTNEMIDSIFNGFPFESRFCEYTRILVFDTAGKLMDHHRVDIKAYRPAYEGSGSPYLEYILGLGNSLMDVDSRGNVYLFTNVNTERTQEWDQEHIAIFRIYDKDTIRSFSLGLENIDNDWEEQTGSAVMIKINPSWTNAECFPLIDSVSGWSRRPLYDSVWHEYYQRWEKPFSMPIEFIFRGLAIDDDDRIYLSGNINAGEGVRSSLSADSLTTLLDVTPPCYFYLDSVHYMVAESYYMLRELPFVLSLDTNGEVRWVNQLYFPMANPSSDYPAPSSPVQSFSLDSNNIYVRINLHRGMDSRQLFFFFDKQHTDTIHTNPDYLNNAFNSHSLNCLVYDRASGNPIGHHLLDTYVIYSRERTPINIINKTITTGVSKVEPVQYYPSWSGMQAVRYNLETGEKVLSPMTYFDPNNISQSCKMLQHPNGFQFWYGTIGSYSGEMRPAGTDTVIYMQKDACYMMLYYDSTLDSRRPQRDTTIHDSTAVFRPQPNGTSFFTLTPNPTDGRVAVEVNSEELKDKSGEATITVCNATGRVVLKQKASTLNSQFSTLNLEALPAGTYFVTVTIGGQSGTRKLVVK